MNNDAKIGVGLGLRDIADPERHDQNMIHGQFEYEPFQNFTAEMFTDLLFGGQTSTVNWGIGVKRHFFDNLALRAELQYAPDYAVLGGIGADLELQPFSAGLGVNCGQWFGEEKGPGCNIGISVGGHFPSEKSGEGNSEHGHHE